ncbi:MULTISPECIES: glycosyltransferase family 4 protein [unclassified Granulicatella]|uniref:glycosyltransferase family 4 protein n=1 Tax=unclassified Granulicatella TaxID=2630493 RepID=UPI001073B945|nr:MULTISPECIES: glycosyltransferase family 4 protein [unclassified Granulicatella]MBF0780261.1 glycosyltransferase family 4 protein [Granulicatella sp. 19428wC4_WM01]TFU95642.1 glycosyltransferase family 4 protein [Granulicatella sp. WM01]
MKKIAFIIYDTSLMGGAENVSIQLANRLSSEYEVSVVSLFQEKKQPFFPIDSKIKHIVIEEQTMSITKHIFKLSKKVRHFLKQEGIDVVFAVTAGVVGVALLSCLGIHTKLVFCEHSNLENQTYGKKHFARQYIGAKFSDKVVVLTNRDKKNYMKRFKVAEDKIDVIYNSFANDERANNMYSGNSTKLVSVGRLTKVKGYDRLIEICKEVFRKHPDWSLDIYGDGDEKQNLLDLIRHNKLEHHIFLRGVTKDVQNTLKDYSFIVMTSYYEGIPLALLEAQSVGLPVVAFNCPTGPEEIVLHEENGYLIENGNNEQAVEKINFLIEHSVIRERFSQQSKKKLYEFSQEKIDEQWKKLINDLVK